ncbi:MAG: thiazole synthase, partial [Pseudomonadota bacterium]
MTSTNPILETPADQPLTIAGRQFDSRLIVGTGKYADYAQNAAAARAAGAQMVTVAMRR